ncbi:MAG: hypothetical protein HYS32_01380 [Candidatus Woesearchaeota archaeon]|nr:MAG: hypothetical protein HYS32_01380 [Candidatus Woesearchaeota archaeon]
MKRGQVTIFIIIGLIVLIAVGVFIYVNTTIEKKKLGVEEQKGLVIPKQVEPIKRFVDSCVEEVTKDAIITAGLQGGYTSLSRDQFLGTPGNIFSNSLQIFSGLNVPYWFYEKASGIQEQKIPSLSQIEEQISNYIDVNLEDCINNLESFEKVGYNFTIEKPKTKTDIRQDEVIVITSYPIEVSIKDTRFRFDRFRSELDVGLGRLYEAAIEVINQENRDFFFEEKTFDFMVIYDQIPLDSIDFECSPRVWSTNGVIKDFKQILALNVPAVKIRGTDNYNEGARKYFTWNIPGRFDSIDINFLYSESWPFFLSVDPNDGGLLKGESFSSNVKNNLIKHAFAFFCMNTYHFVYDVKYPILVVLRDDNAFDGEGFTFQYAFQVILDNNQPRKNALAQPLSEEDGINICHRKEVPTTILTYTSNDNGALVPLEGVKVSYQCITNTCDIGESILDSFGDASLEEDFPNCLNGFVVAQKAGYKEAKQQLSTNQAGQLTSLVLEPIYNKKYEIKIIDPRQGLRDPFENEQVIFTFEGDDYSASVGYPSFGENTIDLIAGNYKVTSYIIRESTQGITFAGTSSTKCFEIPKRGLLGVFGGKEEKCIEINTGPIEVNQVIVGGNEFTWNAERSDLVSSDKVVLYTNYNGFPTSVDSLLNVYNQVKQNKVQEPKFE